MNTTDSIAWSRPPDQADTMAHMNSLDNLDDFFEFSDIDLNAINNLSPAHFGEPVSAPSQHPSTPFEEINEAQAISATTAKDFGAAQHFDHHRYASQDPTSYPYTTESLYQPAIQQTFHQTQAFQFQGQHSYPSSQHVPPTPNSFEMHGDAGHFMQQMDPQQRAILEQRYQLRKEDATAFTPVMSPAGTPYNVPSDYNTVHPGAYFSPLTSPALHAQGNQRYVQGYSHNPRTAPSSNATSPHDHDGDVDMLGDDVVLPESAIASRKSKMKRANTPRSADPLARVKQSPIQKAVKRKPGTMLSSFATSKETDAFKHSPRPNSSQPGSAGLSIPAQFRNDSSESGSISPEPLSEALMGPPPRPSSSVTHSPAMNGQQQQSAATPALGKAATPKSFLSMPGMQQGNSTHSAGDALNADIDSEFVDIQLPGAATDDVGHRPSLPQLNTKIEQGGSSDDTPRITARKTPKLGPLSTPSSARPSSAIASPSVMGSPMTASTPGALLKDKKDAKGSRTNKKRSSTSGSTLVSPALRPKISPSIKPLLPEGSALHSPTHALLLASKSNYQNLLEGNTLPGVNYPESLSSGLSSKRTSHKVAEQGRRNRINEALKEMQSLLPKNAKASKDTSKGDSSPEDAIDGDAKGSKEESAAKSNSSKAATVESANDYIRLLQKENAQMSQLRKQLEDMKKQLAGKSSSSPTSDDHHPPTEVAIDGTSPTD